MSKPDVTFSKVSQFWGIQCLCRGCFPVSYFPVPDGFWNVQDNHHIFNMVNAVLEDRVLDITRGLLDAEF